MRVTKSIREYVEDEIYKKYDAVANEIGSEYFKEQKEVIEAVETLMKEASKNAKAYLDTVGYEFSRYYKDDSLFHLNGNIRKPEVEKIICDRKDKIRAKAREKVRQVLFDLEMGDTEKKQLKDVLDSITVELEE